MYSNGKKTVFTYRHIYKFNLKIQTVMEIKNSYSFLAIGKTQESTETQEFKKYIGVGSSKVVAVNPTKKELEEIYGREQANDPEYVVDGDNGKEARITFVVKTDPDVNNGIEIINRVMFTLRNTPAYNRDQTKVQVIDKYGNAVWADVEAAKAGGKILTSKGNDAKIASGYRMACVGEADLIGFLKAYLCVDDAFNYINSSWVLKDNADDCVFGLEHIKDYFTGDFSEIKEAIALQPNNKVKLLYGVRTTDDGKQYQTVATRDGMVLRNNAGSNALVRLEKTLADAKAAGSYASTEFKVQELTEFDVKATDLSNAPVATGTESAGGDMPWD